MQAPTPITRLQLEQKMRAQPPDNRDRENGYALVNVLDQETFRDEHIPSSINIPKNEVERFEQRFAKDKEIVVYCASPKCDASPTTAKALAERGFDNVLDYEGGMSDWKAGGNPVASGIA